MGGFIQTGASRHQSRGKQAPPGPPSAEVMARVSISGGRGRPRLAQTMGITSGRSVNGGPGLASTSPHVKSGGAPRRERDAGYRSSLPFRGMHSRGPPGGGKGRCDRVHGPPVRGQGREGAGEWSQQCRVQRQRRSWRSHCRFVAELHARGVRGWWGLRGSRDVLGTCSKYRR